MAFQERPQRKRGMDSVPFDGGNPKRPKNHNPKDEPLLKLLVPSYVAGALIGKGGAKLKELGKTFGGFIRISAGKEFYPGTDERVVVVTGDKPQLTNISNHIMEKVKDPGRDETMKNVELTPGRADIVKIVLTDTAAGYLIGRAGANIKVIQEESKARMHVDMPEKAAVRGERLLTIRGSFEQCTTACRMVIEKVSNDRSNKANTKLAYGAGMDDLLSAGGLGEPSFNAREPGFNNREQQGYSAREPSYSNREPSYNNTREPSYNNAREPSFNNARESSYNNARESSYNNAREPSFNTRDFDIGALLSGSSFDSMAHPGTSASQRGRMSDYPPPPQSDLEMRILNARVSVEIDVPERVVGPILGTKGSIIKDMVHRSGGAKFKFSEKAEGGGDRTLNIKGDMKQVQSAYILLGERVAEIDKSGPVSTYN